jgi:hypothetical protein
MEQRFMDKVQEREDGCWDWTSVKASDGRGLFRMHPGEYKWTKAHVASLAILRGEERGDDREVHHTCLNGKCVNPDHLQILTPAEHVAEHKRIREELGIG